MLSYQIHPNDRASVARSLSLSLYQFDRLVQAANHAYEVIKELGPFYGREEVKEPTFRITAEPVILPKEAKEILETFGQDCLHLAKALQKLPDEAKNQLGKELDFRVPPTWRIDVILDEKGNPRVNEIEGMDGANALMMAEQLAYNLQDLSDSTAAKLIPTLKTICGSSEKLVKIALIRLDSPHNANAQRFIHFLEVLSHESLKVEYIDENSLLEGSVVPNWAKYSGIILETSFPPQKLYKVGLPKEKVISNGVYNALGNKGVFALLFEKGLQNFWTDNLGLERYRRLKNILIPTSFITTQEELQKAREKGKVVKVSWAGENGYLINRSKGVALPEESVEQGSEERWNLLSALLKQGVKMVVQDFVVPARIPSFLRKKGTNLELVNWYNRICVKYVVEGRPNDSLIPTVAMTAAEATLGPDIVPAGRKCAFTAVKFS